MISSATCDGPCFAEGGQLTSAATDIPSSRVHKVWLQHTSDNEGNIVGVAAKDNGLLSHPGAAYLGGNGPTKLAGRKLISEFPNQCQIRLGFGNIPYFLVRGQNADDVQDRKHECGTTEISSPSANSRHDEDPAEKSSAESEGITTEVEVVNLAGLETNLFVEVGRVVRNGSAAQNLAKEGHTGNLSPSKLEALETVQVRRANTELLLKIVSVHNSGEGLLRVDGAVFALKASDGCLGLLKSTLTNKMPG